MQKTRYRCAICKREVTSKLYDSYVLTCAIDLYQQHLNFGSPALCAGIQRRCYWLLDGDDNVVLVHYLSSNPMANCIMRSPSLGQASTYAGASSLNAVEAATPQVRCSLSSVVNFYMCESTSHAANPHSRCCSTCDR